MCQCVTVSHVCMCVCACVYVHVCVHVCVCMRVCVAIQSSFTILLLGGDQVDLGTC